MERAAATVGLGDGVSRAVLERDPAVLARADNRLKTGRSVEEHELHIPIEVIGRGNAGRHALLNPIRLQAVPERVADRQPIGRLEVQRRGDPFPGTHCVTRHRLSPGRLPA